jgi:hypothetical protein
MGERKLKLKPSLYPQMVTEDIWYYENRGYLEFFVHSEAIRKLPADTALRFKVRRSRLDKSLLRSVRSSGG